MDDGRWTMDDGRWTNGETDTMQFDHEKLDVYQLELSFIAWVSTLLAELSDQRGRRMAEVSDQLDRASLSSLLK